jgi:hypothetical protein
MSTTHTPRSTASKVNMPGFTAECVLSVTGRGDRVSGLPRRERGMAASGGRVAVARGGGGGGSNFWCDETVGTCSCLAGPSPR